MKSSYLHLIIAVSGILLMSRCGSKNTAEIVSSNVTQELKIQQNLEFEFDKDMVGDSLVNYWDTIPYLSIEPPVQGRYKWTSTNQLIFSPAGAFAPATKYQISFTKQLSQLTGFNLSGKKSFETHTPLLQLDGFNAYWSSRESKTYASLDLTFNYPVDAQHILKNLTVTLGGESKDAKLIESADQTLVKLFLPDVKMEDEDFDIKAELAAGIKPKEGNLGTASNIEHSSTLISPFKVVIEDVETSHDGSEGKVTIQFSQQVAKPAESFIDILPAIDFELEYTASGLVVKSEDFNARTKYKLTLKKGLKGEFGGELKKEDTREISFGELRPEISFANQNAMYLAGSGEKNVQLKIINVDEVQVTVIKLYENNIINFMRQTQYDYDRDVYGYNFYNADELGDEILNKKIQVSSLPKKDGNKLINLDFMDKLNDYKGIYIIKVSSDEQYWLRDYKLLTISDLGLVAKEGQKNVTVFVNSIKTAKPVEGVTISYFGRNNQKIGQAKTDANGVAILQKSSDRPDGFSVDMITASLSQDYNIMRLGNSGVNTSQFEVGGKRPNLSGYDVYMYGEREMYRPGETINITGILRDDRWNTPDRVPVKLEVVTPDGKILKRIKKTLNQHGSFEASIALLPSAKTGSYSIRLYTANDVYLAAMSIKVEEFMPDRIKLEVDIAKPTIDITESIKVALTAVNFFGPPAANRNYEFTISSARRGFYAKKFSDYNFDLEGTDGYFKSEVLEGKTNAQGQASFDYQLPLEYKNMGIVSTDIFTTVFDDTGRPVNKKSTIDIYTQKSFLGIACDRYYTATNSEIQLPYIALDKDQNVLQGAKARLTLIKHEYRTVLSKSGSYFRYTSEKVERVLVDEDVVIAGEKQFFKYVPELSGRYELRLYNPGAYSYVSKHFYAYGWGGTSNSSFEVNSEGQIEIVLDKESYQPGETANVLLKSPFNGKVLVTVESDEIIKHFYVNVDKRSTAFQLEVEEGFVPNVYVTATLFKPHQESDLPLTVAHGVAPMMVENPSLEIPVTITAPKSSRSKTKQKIKIKGAPNSAVTVAAVDEGILQLTSYQTPDPYQFFYRKRALGVSSYDIYPYLFPEVKVGTSHVGGDGYYDSEMGKRVNPLTNKRVKLVSFWSGILETDGSGNAEFEMDIPQFSGDIRIMAANYANNLFGSESINMKVADPIVISTGLPRFLSPKDTVIVPVTISNTTDKSTKAKSTISVSGPLEIVGESKQTSSIEGNTEGRVIYKLLAKTALGEGKVSVKVDAMGEQFAEDIDITVRPASPLQKVNLSGQINGGSSKTLTFSDQHFMEQSRNRKLVVSKSPMAAFTKDLDYLVRYPYGCIEQTVSSVFPQLYFEDLTAAIYRNSDEQSANVNQNINAAIEKLYTMQLYNGAMTYWPGRGTESWWGSVYAAHFLVEARKAGYSVDETVLNKLLDYVKTKIKKRSTILYYYNNTSRTIISKEIPYSLYVLALAGQPERSTMNYYKNNLNDLSIDGKYLVAASYALIGDQKKYKEVLPQVYEGEKSKRCTGGSFYSYIRDEAISLNVLLEVEPTNPQVGSMIKRISNYLNTERYLNTQERVFSFLALGKFSKLNASNNASATVKVAGKSVGELSKKNLVLASDKLGGKEVTIEASGSGTIFYFWESEGISADGSYVQEDAQIQVRKSFYSRNGLQITNGRFEQNDLVVVKLSISALAGKKHENVAMVDILPAGFEIENPRISDLPDMQWIKDESTADHTDIRDDRIMYFMDVYAQTKNYYYVVRAVTEGAFQMGPVGADAMYDGEIHSYSGGGIIVVE